MIASLLSRIGIEFWKDIPTFEKKYQVSNLGNVRALNYMRRGFIKNIYTFIDSRNRLSCILYKKGKGKHLRVHQLVAMAFLKHKPCGMKLVVDHINNKPNNNKLYNLQIITQRENSSKDTKGKSKYVGVYWHKGANKWAANIAVGSKSKGLGLFVDEKEAAKAYQNELKKINETKETHTDTTHT